MAVVLYQKMPVGTTMDFIEAVNKEIGAVDDPPAGLIVHTVVDMGDCLAIVDVWESRQALDDFGQNRLGPGLARVAERHGMDLSQAQSEVEVLDALQIIQGR